MSHRFADIVLLCLGFSLVAVGCLGLSSTVQQQALPRWRSMLSVTEEEGERLGRRLNVKQIFAKLNDERAVRNLEKIQRRLDLDDRELKHVVMRQPNILRANAIDTDYEFNLKSLTKRFDLDDAELKHLVVGLPPVLGLSWPLNIEPKLDFLQKEIPLTNDELRRRVLKRPTMLGYSLERRYKPRIQFCRDVQAPLRLVVSYAARTDKQFHDLVAQWIKTHHPQEDRPTDVVTKEEATTTPTANNRLPDDGDHRHPGETTLEL